MAGLAVSVVLMILIAYGLFAIELAKRITALITLCLYVAEQNANLASLMAVSGKEIIDLRAKVTRLERELGEV